MFGAKPISEEMHYIEIILSSTPSVLQANFKCKWGEDALRPFVLPASTQKSKFDVLRCKIPSGCCQGRRWLFAMQKLTWIWYTADRPAVLSEDSEEPWIATFQRPQKELTLTLWGKNTELKLGGRMVLKGMPHQSWQSRRKNKPDT